MSTFFDLIPDEITYQILLYLDIDDIDSLSHDFRIDKIIKSKLFWIQKLTKDKMELYIPFLTKFTDNYIDQYYEFVRISERVDELIKSFMDYPIMMGILIPDEVELDDIINDFTIEEIRQLNISTSGGRQFMITYRDGLQFYYYIDHVNYDRNVKFLTDKEFWDP